MERLIDFREFRAEPGVSRAADATEAQAEELLVSVQGLFD